MAAKMLSTIGALALVALGATGLAALAVVKQRVQVTVEPPIDERERGPDALELVRADVATLRDDLAAFSGAMGPQLEQLRDSLDQSGAERSATSRAQIEALRGELRTIAARLGELEQRSELDAQRVAAALESVAERRALETAAAAPSAESAVDVRPEAAVEPSPESVEKSAEVVAALEPAAEPEIEPEPEPAANAPAKGRSFLSFTLPSQSFRFEGRQRLSIVPSLSRVGFDAKSTLHDFSGVTQRVSGELIVDLSAPTVGCEGTVRVEAQSLDTGMAERDEGMRKQLDVARHPELVFEWKSFRDAKVDVARHSLTGTAVGFLSIKGARREAAMPVRVSVDASKRVTIEGELAVKMSDFGVSPPSQLGVIRVEDSVRVWIALRARTLGAVAANEASAPVASERGDGR